MARPPQTTDETPREGERIAKLLARAGVASRREVERMIAEGRVRIGDTLVETPATILPSLAGVSVDGKPVNAAPPARLFRFHKPAGLLTAERDPAGRPTIYTALRNALPADAPRVMPVGRLDLNTEGLLLLTNDGGLKRVLELPATGIPRTYRARAYGTVSQAQLEELSEGLEIDGVRYGSIDANMERRTGRNQWIELTLTEGKNREVRRVLEWLGLTVSRLLRTAYGPFALGPLQRGSVDEVRQIDVERLMRALKVGGPMPEISAATAPVRRERVKPAPAPAPAPSPTAAGRRGRARTEPAAAAPSPKPQRRRIREVREQLETSPRRLTRKPDGSRPPRPSGGKPSRRPGKPAPRKP